MGEFGNESFAVAMLLGLVYMLNLRSCHATESKLLRVHSDIALSVDAVKPAVLMLLDLTAAFDTMDHAVLQSHLDHCVGSRGTMLKWFRSYLANRNFSKMTGDLSSSHAPLFSGVPQGSILGLILFSLDVLPSGAIIIKHNVSF